MKRQSTGHSNKSATSSTKGGLNKKVTSSAAQDILNKLEAEVARQSEQQSDMGKSNAESFYDDDDDGDDNVNIKAEELIFNPESQ